MATALQREWFNLISTIYDNINNVNYDTSTPLE